MRIGSCGVMGFYLMLGFYFDLFSMPVKLMCVSSWIGIRQVIIMLFCDNRVNEQNWSSGFSKFL